MEIGIIRKGVHPKYDRDHVATWRVRYRAQAKQARWQTVAVPFTTRLAMLEAEKLASDGWQVQIDLYAQPVDNAVYRK